MDQSASIQTLSEGTAADNKTNNPIVAERNPKTFEVKNPDYSADERTFRSQLIYELCLARDQRDRYHPELDMMTYVEYHESNRKKDLSFIPSKKNKDDVRIVTGTTREKDTTLLNAGLNMNLTPEITAFDDEDMVVNELGVNMSDLVSKSREIEEYSRIRGLIYREMISQGDVFVQELWTEDFRAMPVDDVKWNPNKDDVKSFDIKRRVQKIFEGAKVRMVNGKKIYLGNIRCPYIEDQQMVAVLNVIPRAEAEAKYRNWERWQNVPYTVDTVTAFYDDGSTYKDWNLVTLNDRDKVAEIMIYWKQKNCFMIMLNGVMMLPIDYPLTAISPTGEIPMSQGKLEPISDFAYSKSQPSSTKIDQEVLDETLKLMIGKARQSYKPPMGTKGKKVYSPNIFMAGKITNEIGDGDLFPLLGNFAAGVTAADFQFYQMIKQNIDEKTTSPNFGGQNDQQDQTATETIEMKNQQMMQLGLFLDGLVNLEKRLVWNRIYTLLTHWTKKQDTSIDNVKQGIFDGYKTLSVGTTLESGQKGTKVFRFTAPHKRPHIRDHEQQEEDMSKMHGQPVRVVYLDPEMLREIKYKWFIVITPAPKSNDKLSQLMYIQNLEQAMQIFGPESINMDYAKQRYASVIKEDYNKFFVKTSMQQMLQQNQMGQQNGNQNPGQNVPGKAMAPKKPMQVGMGPKISSAMAS